MRELKQLIKIMSQAEIAKRLKITRANVTYWKTIGRIPPKQQKKLELLYKKEVLNVQKR
jgi:DNA-binding transcriptional MerR regulator